MHLTFSHFFLGHKKGFLKKFLVSWTWPCGQKHYWNTCSRFPHYKSRRNNCPFLIPNPKDPRIPHTYPKKKFLLFFSVWTLNSPPFSCPFFTGEEETSSSQPFRGESGDVILSGVPVFFFFFFCWKGRKTIELLEGCRQDASSPGIQIATSWDLADEKELSACILWV